MSDYPRTAPSSIALAGFVSGVLAFACAPGAGGIVALVLGWTAHKELRQPKHTRGRHLALAALGLGAANVVFVLVILFLGSTAFYGAPRPARTDARAAPALDRGLPREALPRQVGAGAHQLPHHSEDSAVQSVRIGQLELVDIGSGVDSLSGELERQTRTAQRAGTRLLLWVSAPDCAPCNGVSSALSHPEMQRALQRTRVVRVNRDDFAAELDAMGVPFHAIPGFALLDAQIRPLDYVDGGEWEEDTPRNIAPVLAGFMRGNYNARRRPWHGTTRRKITAL